MIGWKRHKQESCKESGRDRKPKKELVGVQTRRCKDSSERPTKTMWRDPKIEALFWSKHPNGGLTPRREPVRTDPVRRHVLELRERKFHVCLLSPSAHNILFLFVEQMWLTQFSYAVSLFSTTNKKFNSK